MGKKIVAVLCALLAVSSFSGCVKNVTPSVSAVVSSSETEAVETTAINDDTSFPLNAYAHLSSEKKKVYKKIVTAVKNRDELIQETADEYQSEIFDKVFYYAVAVDYPEFFYVQPFSESYSSGGEIVKANFKLKYIYSVQEVQQKLEAIEEIISKIKSQHSAPTDYDIALSAYNYLIDNCDYDDALANSKNGTQNDSGSTMEGALLDNSAVCTGYSRAYKYILNKLGLKCTVINTKEHEWNLVMLDGEYYYSDVTWGDTSGNKYKYFNITTEQLKKDHTLPDENLPVCTATKDNYYYH